MLSTRQSQILDLFLDEPNEALSAGDLLPQFNIGRTSLFRDLTVLTEAGLIAASDGSTRSRTYRLHPNSDEYIRWDLSRPPQQRHEVNYQPELLISYQPNQSYLLTQEQRELMAEVGEISNDQALEQDSKNYHRLIASLLIDLAHASSSLENVPISWLDTKTLIEFGERPDGLNDTELKIVLNHKKAITHLTDNAATMSIAPKDLFDLHTLIADGLIPEVTAVGRLRQRVVRFSDSRYLPPANPHLLRDAFELFCEKADAIENPFEQAFFAMSFLPYLQPFQDGNKRTSRLTMNIPLLKSQLAPFSFSDMKKRDYMIGLLAFYERGKHRFLADAFVRSYQKTAPCYAELLDCVQQGGALGSLT